MGLYFQEYLKIKSYLGVCSSIFLTASCDDYFVCNFALLSKICVIILGLRWRGPSRLQLIKNSVFPLKMPLTVDILRGVDPSDIKSYISTHHNKPCHFHL